MITDETKQNILDALVVENIAWHGDLDEVKFLRPLFNLRAMPSEDPRFDNAEEDIHQHCILHNDWPNDWIFDDGRFDLHHATDATFLAFLTRIIHPTVRRDTDETRRIVDIFNGILQADGWHFVATSDQVGRPLFAAQPIRRLLPGAARPPQVAIDDSLPSWREVRQSRPYLKFGNLLIGNGASLAVWSKFGYGTLYQIATEGILTHNLSAEDQRIFYEMGNTTNFELVLSALWTADMVCGVLDIEAPIIQTRYQSIQNALFDAVHHVHVKKKDDDENIFSAIGAELRTFQAVYSTNYDLIVYWSIMTFGAGGFKDYFWDGAFDPADTEVWPWPEADPTRILYLHGGIHLAKMPSGATIKRQAADFSNLLTSFDDLRGLNAVPLFITEGRSTDKLSSIHRSDYLSFAYQQFAQRKESIVVFGHSLSDYDNHLVDAMKNWINPTIAFGMRPVRPDDAAARANLVARKAQLRDKLPDAEILFFDSTTHPLGLDSLKIEPTES